MILVTGATGNIGNSLVEQLSRAGAGPVRALTRDPARAALPGTVDVVAGDLARPVSLKPALDGASSLFLLSGVGAGGPGPDSAVEPVELYGEIVDVARRAGVAHVVLVSSITVETHPHLGPAQQNLAVEELLKESGMAWTVLRPTQFASNCLRWAAGIRDDGTVRVPYADVGLPTVHPADIAAVARVALTEERHRGRSHVVTGPERITPRRQAAAIATATGRAVRLVEVERAEAQRELASVLGEESASAVLDVTGGDVNEALLAVHDTVRRLTGVPARTFRAWAAENAGAFR
ncbi:hypothetical protein OK074_7611 [Actinobacteria bacterium OK074]|nr:hypothetical protein OK074_7611 [Actinobacteria bacterium OK074]